MRFLAYDLSLETIRGLRPAIARIRRHSKRLATQLEDALSSTSLNLAEGNGRTGGDRLHHFRISLGSLREVGSCLDVAVAQTWLDDAPMFAERDRLCGMIFGLQRR